MRRPSISTILAGPKARITVFGVFVAAAFLAGGGSREDIISLIFLYPFSILAALYALLVARADDYHRVRVPLALLLALGAVMALQLMPLPPSLWHELPQRQTIAQIDDMLGINDIWRPLTLSPSATLNSLVSLVVPIAGLLLLAVLPRDSMKLVVAIILGAAGVSLLLGIAQMLGSDHSALYLYRITNNGSPVGLFSNRNHQGVFLAMAVALSAFMIAAQAGAKQPVNFRSFGLALFILILSALILVNGSRAGLLVMLMAYIVGAAFFAFRPDSEKRQRSPRRFRRNVDRWAGRINLTTVFVLVAVLCGAGLAFIAFSDTIAVQRLLQTNLSEDLRAETLPTIVSMATGFLPFGAGFGTFEFAYRMNEPLELLSGAYLNEAHNDWLQLVLEGGVPALALLFAYMAWLVTKVRALIGSGATSARSFRPRLLCIAMILFLAVASAFDYPLRVPSVALLLALFSGLLSRLDRASASGERR